MNESFFFYHEIHVVRMPNMFILMGMQIKVRNFTDKIYILFEMCVRFCFQQRLLLVFLLHFCFAVVLVCYGWLMFTRFKCCCNYRVLVERGRRILISHITPGHFIQNFILHTGSAVEKYSLSPRQYQTIYAIKHRHTNLDGKTIYQSKYNYILYIFGYLFVIFIRLLL